jgi:membrane associated rhomboid family serine protease
LTSPQFASNRDNFCYRHPDRQSFALCQRCGRTICGECQTQAPVGVICPECLRGQQASSAAGPVRMPRAPRALQRVSNDSRPLVTWWIIGITVVIYFLQLIPGSPVQSWLQFAGAYVTPGLAPLEPWRLLTSLLVHGGFLHVGLNMLALWMIGRSLEPLLGHGRFLALYLISGLGGSVAVTFLTDPLTATVGASGAIFGLFGALLVIGRHIGANVTGIAIIIAINFAFPFVQGIIGGSLAAVQISWQAHLGGLMTGALVGYIFARTRSVRQRRLQLWLLIAVAGGLIAVLVARAALWT